MIRVGVAGCGAIAQLVHLPLLRDSKRAETVGVCDLSVAQAEAVAARFGVSRVYPDWREMVSDPSIEAILVCTSSDSHAPVTIGALESGKHVLVEKPMAMSLADAEEMARTAEERGLVLMVGYMWRHDPGCEKAIELYRSGRIGKCFLATVESLEGGDLWAAGRLGDVLRAGPVPTDEELRRPGFLEGSADHQHYVLLADIGSHLVNLLGAFLGAPESVISADAYKESKDPEGWSTMSFVSKFRYPRGMATFSSSLFMGDVFEKRIRLLGPEGWIEVSLSPSLEMMVPSKVTSFDLKTGSRETHCVEPAASFGREHEHFLDCIEKGGSPRTAGGEGVEELRVREAMMKAWKERRETRL